MQNRAGCSNTVAAVMQNRAGCSNTVAAVMLNYAVSRKVKNIFKNGPTEKKLFFFTALKKTLCSQLSVFIHYG
jgi:hypothetical protein